MKQLGKRILCCLLSLLLLTPKTAFASEYNYEEMIHETADSIQALSEAGADSLLKDETNILAGESTSDWIAMVLAFAGEKDAYAYYLDQLNQYVARQYGQKGCLEDFKATEYHRIILTMLAMGGNPEAIETGDGTINLVADGTYNFHGEALSQQGSNGLIYALLALDSMDYEVPENAKFTRDDMIEELLNCQSADGGFALAGNSGGDLDITAMALQALAPYTDLEEVNTAVSQALEWISAQMTEKGTFSVYESESVESIAQVILALCALDIDPETDERFVKDGVSLLDGLNRFRMENGMYMHTESDGESDPIATYQALLALEAVEKRNAKEGWILDFNGYQAPERTSDFSMGSMIAAAGVLILAALAVILAVKKRKMPTKQEGRNR